MKKENKKKKVLTDLEKKEILDKNTDIIYKFCHKNKNRYRDKYENFEEFISDCILFAYDYIGKWDPERSALSTYLFTTLPWRIQNAQRKIKNDRKDVSLEKIINRGLEMEALELEMIKQKEAERDAKTLELVIPLLHEYTKEHYLEGKTYNQIGEEKGVDPVKVRNIVYRDMKKIRAVVENEIE